MSRLSLSLAISDYDHVRDLVTGRVQPEGIDLVPSVLNVEEIFYRTTHFQEWDISEMSFGKYSSLRSQGDDRLVGLPIFPSRSFRQSSLYVRRDGPIQHPGDLRGKRIGIPEWAQTAAIYSRGWIAHSLGIPLSEIEWVQGGVNQAGRKEKVNVHVPEGVSYRPEPGHSLTSLLLDGRIDAILSARAPEPGQERAGEIVRLFPHFADVERDYFEATRIFPIMHLIVLRRETFERNRWIAGNLLKAFEEAKRNSLERLSDITCSHFPLPWMPSRVADAQALFGADIWPYGLEPNRTTLEAFLRFGYEQGVCHRLLTPEELFPAETLSTVRV
ncbi:4,5-dihydroxyphthalate decarboxylase [Burkholderia sp. WSM2230]|uniref:4,5-dihydroxyphthalate decarboxylase n=1 Tax=Burkholderia sp. WSM2230 TaxID=944435 RepID=UPI0004069F42|nr:4,5-dihydroxyphthalate decarboxylase [Burkholderia sp. WSM2230]